MSPEAAAVRADQYLAPETLVQLAPFELRAKMIVEGVMSGMHRSPYQGMAVEFAEHRQYSPGDDLKHLDWKVFGRSDKLYIKQYQQETNLDVILMIDSSVSMGYGSLEIKPDWGGTTASERARRWTKFDHATALATAMSYLCLHQQDRVGVCVFADDVRTMIKRSSAQGQWRRIVSALRTEPVVAATNLAKVTDQVLGKITNRALFGRDRSTCLYCGKHMADAELTRDHVMPVSRGGKDTWDNVVAACKRCNHFKGSRILEECGMELLALPYVPNFAEYLALINSGRILGDQMDFLRKNFGANSRLLH